MGSFERKTGGGGSSSKKLRGQGAKRKVLRQPPIKEFMDDNPEATPTTTPADAALAALLDSIYDEPQGSTKATKKKYSGRGDGSAERLDLIRKEVIRNNPSFGEDGKFTSSISGKSYMNGGSVRAFNNGGAVMKGRGPKFKGTT